MLNRVFSMSTRVPLTILVVLLLSCPLKAERLEKSFVPALKSASAIWRVTIEEATPLGHGEYGAFISYRIVPISALRESKTSMSESDIWVHYSSRQTKFGSGAESSLKKGTKYIVFFTEENTKENAAQGKPNLVLLRAEPIEKVSEVTAKLRHFYPEKYPLSGLEWRDKFQELKEGMKRIDVEKIIARVRGKNSTYSTRGMSHRSLVAYRLAPDSILLVWYKPGAPAKKLLTGGHTSATDATFIKFDVLQLQ